MSNYTTANTINDLFRDLFALIDEVAYSILGKMYEILFNVAGADLFTNETIKNFYVRVQLIIGIFMDRLIPTKQEKIEKEYVKIFKDAVEKDLEQEKVKKKN